MGTYSVIGIEQDISKLHGEINQAVNHRFLLTAAGITSLALLGRYMFPGADFDVSRVLKSIPYYFAFILVLTVLYVQSVFIRKVIRTYSTYLIAKGWSSWEADWYSARYAKGYQINRLVKNDKYAHEIVFLCLSFIALLLGSYHLFVFWKNNMVGDLISALRAGESGEFTMVSILLLSAILLNLLVIAVIVIGFLLTGDRKNSEDNLIQAWHSLIDNCNDGSSKMISGVDH